MLIQQLGCTDAQTHKRSKRTVLYCTVLFWLVLCASERASVLLCTQRREQHCKALPVKLAARQAAWKRLRMIDRLIHYSNVDRSNIRMRRPTTALTGDARTAPDSRCWRPPTQVGADDDDADADDTLVTCAGAWNNARTPTGAL